MTTKDGKILLIGILVGVILTLVLLRAANILFVPVNEMDDNMVQDSFSYEPTDQIEPSFESSESAIEEVDLQNP